MILWLSFFQHETLQERTAFRLGDFTPLEKIPELPRKFLGQFLQEIPFMDSPAALTVREGTNKWKLQTVVIKERHGHKET